MGTATSMANDATGTSAPQARQAVGENLSQSGFAFARHSLPVQGLLLGGLSPLFAALGFAEWDLEERSELTGVQDISKKLRMTFTFTIQNSLLGRWYVDQESQGLS